MEEKILLVDDEEGIRKVLGITLADSGYEVLTAENGKEALRIFTEERPEIVLSDIKMPGMDGIELLKRIKRENPDTEVILITGHGDMDLAIQSLKNEAVGFITKPVSDEALERALQKAREKILNRRKLREYTESLESLVQQKSERLREAEKLLSQSQIKAFDEMPCYVMIHDRAFGITTANRLLREDFGDGTGKPCHRVLRGSAKPCADCPSAKTFRDGKSHHAELLLSPEGGEQRRVFVWTRPLSDAAGEVRQVMVMATDLSRVVEMQDHLSSLGLMIASVSHSIKGLLTGLDGGVYLLDSGLSKNRPERMRDGLKTVKLISDRIKNMVLDILYYAKERDLDKTKVRLSAFAEDVADVVEPKMRDRSIEFVRDFPRLSDESRTDEIEVDEAQLRSALINILENAADACEEDKSKNAHKIVFRAEKEGEDATFEIQDNGIGMDEETKKKVFTLFFSTKASRGTGMGLFVADKIVRQHGGSIETTSEPGKGTLFRIKMGGV